MVVLTYNSQHVGGWLPVRTFFFVCVILGVELRVSQALYQLSHPAKCTYFSLISSNRQALVVDPYNPRYLERLRLGRSWFEASLGQ
jgi:hypothetical protein